MLTARRCLFAPSQQCLPLAGACLLVCSPATITISCLFAPAATNFFCLCAFPCSNTTTNNALCASPFLHTLCYYTNNDHHDQCKTIPMITWHALDSSQQSSAIAFVLCDTNQPCWWQQQPKRSPRSQSNKWSQRSLYNASSLLQPRTQWRILLQWCLSNVTINDFVFSTINWQQQSICYWTLLFQPIFWPYCFQSKWIQSYVENHPMAMTTLSVRFIPRFSATASILSMAYASNHLSKDKQLSSRPCDGASFMTVRPLRQHVQCDNGYDNMSYATTVRPCDNQHFCLNDNGNNAHCCSPTTVTVSKHNLIITQQSLWLRQQLSKHACAVLSAV